MISIIICTRNRPLEASNCINSLLSQNGNFEVVLVDQSDLLNEYPVDSRLRVVKSTEKGLSCARNTGIRNSSGEVVAFVDDDAIFSKDYVKELARSFSNNDIDGVAGRILITGTEMPYAKTQTEKSRRLFSEDWTAVLGGNIAFGRRVFNEIGYFDERFGAGREWASGEETDFFFRMQYREKRINYCADLVVFHPPEAERHSLEALSRKLFSYGKGQGALFAKHYKEFKNRKIILSLIWSLSKPCLRIVEYLIIHSEAKFKIQCAILSGRIRGFREFMHQSAESRPLL